MEWKPIASAPFNRDLELAVIDYYGTHALIFPCRRVLGGWISAKTKQRIDVRPSHWREWLVGIDLALVFLLVVARRIVQRCQLRLFFGKQLNKRLSLCRVLLGSEHPAVVVDVELRNKDTLVHGASIAAIRSHIILQPEPLSDPFLQRGKGEPAAVRQC